MTAGCHHAGTVPPGWRGEAISLDTHEQARRGHPTSSLDALNTDQGNGHDAQGLLQVFICYGQVLSNHATLRLSAPGKQTLMWDPGGTYGQDDPVYARHKDVLTRSATTVNEWWIYRRDRCREPVMEVFQWSLSPKQAQRLHALLLTGEDPADPAQTFDTDGSGLQCSNKVSAFLMCFADGRPAVHARMFWPHELGEHLWKQSPDRVLVFRSEGESQVYLRDTGSAATKQQDDPADRHGRAGDGAQADSLTEHRGDRQHE